MKTIQVIAKGNVQGVGFRAHAKLRAYQYSITGYAKNLEDGTVILEATGKVDKVEKWLTKIGSYPSSSTELVVDTLNHPTVVKGFKVL